MNVLNQTGRPGRRKYVSMKKINKKALAALIAQRGNIHKDYALIVLNDLDEVIAEQVKENEGGVNIDNIGTFRRVVKPATRRYIPSKGTEVDIPERVTVKLRVSKTLVQRVQ
jgi:nucleoid DNA-binding protein